VSTKSVYQWRRAWRADGEKALASKGPGGSACKLDQDQLARLGAALDAGPAASGWGCDQRWTLARVAAPITRLSGVDYTLLGVSYLLHRMGFTPQVPAHRAAERDEAKIADWRSGRCGWRRGRCGCGPAPVTVPGVRGDACAAASVVLVAAGR
jgi:transposase